MIGMKKITKVEERYLIYCEHVYLIPTPIGNTTPSWTTGVTTVKIVSQKGVHPRSTLLLPLRRISFSSEKACRCKKTNECSGSFRDKKRTVHYCRVVGRGSWFIWSLPGWIVNRERVAARRSNSKKPTHVWSPARHAIDKLQRLLY